MSIWDDPAVKRAAAASNFQKFIDIGDTWKGTVATVGKHTWNDGSVAVKITPAEDDVPVVTASQILLMQALFELKPTKGDILEIALAGIETNGGKTLKKFTVSVTKPDGQVDTVDQVND